MFKDLPQGKTHYVGDGCKDEHGRLPNQKVEQQGDWENRFKQEFGIHFSKSELQFVLEFVKDEIIKSYKDGYNTCLSDFKIENKYGEKSL